MTNKTNDLWEAKVWKLSSWKGLSLENYKSMHKETAKNKNVLAAFLAAPNVTQAKKILFNKK